MISVFSNTANSTEELAGLGYPILDNWCKSATLFATLNGEQYIKLEIPHKAFAIDRKKLPNGRDILKIIDMDDEEDYYRVRKPKFDLKTTTIIAEHISADLIDNLIEDINIVNANGSEAMAKIKAGTQYTHPFDFRSNIMSTTNIRIVRINPLQALIGTADNTFVKRFGGELRRRRFTLTVNDRIGVHRTGTIRSKKDLTGFESEVDWDAVATRIMPKGPNGVLIPEKYVDSPLINKYEHPIIKVIEYHVEYEGDFKDLPKSEKERVYNELRAAAKKSFLDGIDLPTAMYTIDFTNLQKTEEYKDYEALEKYSLGDTVDVYESSHDLFVTAKILYIEWDILKKKYLRMILGNIKDGIVRGSINKSTVSLAKAERAEKIANFALASADGKTTNYYGYAKPDNPQKGDLWYKRNGDEDEIWQWQEVNGKYQWVYLLGTAQANQIKREFESKTKEIDQSMAAQAQQTTQALRMAGANASAIEAAKGAITKLNQDLAGAKTDLTQAQSQLSGSISQIRSDVGAIRNQQTIYEQSNTQRLARITGQLGDKASKTEVKQTADRIREELARFDATGRNLFLNSLFKQDIRKTGIWTTSTYTVSVDSQNKYLGYNALKIVGQDPTGRDGGNPKITYPATGQYGKVAPGSMSNQDVTLSFYAKAEKGGTILRSRLGNIGFKDGNVTLTTEIKRYVVKLPKNWTNWSKLTSNEWLFNLNRADTVWIWMPKFEVSDDATSYSEAPEDVDGQITEAKASFERTAQGLRTDLTSVQSYVSADGARTEALQKYSREETARQLTAVRQSIEAGYVAKAQHTEDVRGLTNRFEELKTNSETRLAKYKQSVDGQFATIAQQIAGKASQTEFQRLQETSKLYERLIGSTEADIPNKVSRMVMTNELFQVEVSKNQGLRTVQSQLAGSWAVQNLNSAGDLISGLNLGANGVNRLDGRLTHITGQTLIDNAVIKSAMIESVLADKITTGTLNAANVNIINLNANKINGLDATFLRGKIENAIIDWLVGKTIVSQNGSTVLNLQTGKFTLDDEYSSITFRRGSDNTKTEFNKDGITFLLDRKVTAVLGQGYNTSIYENSTRKCFLLSLSNEQGLAFTTQGNSTFFEINPQKKNLSIQSEFTLLIGGRTSQSVSLEHRFGRYNGVNFSSFRAKGTKNQELRFYADGRIEITRGY